MKTNQIVRLISLVGLLIPTLVLLGSKNKNSVYLDLAVLIAFAMMVLLYYAFFRERVIGDKSDKVPAKSVWFTFVAVGLWICFCVCHAWPH